MKILFLTGREFHYQRNIYVYNLLKNFGDVIVYHSKIEKFTQRSILRRTVLLTALVYLNKASNPDLVFIGFYGHILTILLRNLIKCPILFDAFISTYDTLCFDRKRFSPKSIPGQLSYWMDKKSCELANIVLLDTPQHVTYFKNTFRLEKKKMYSIPVGCDEDIFFPRKEKILKQENFTVLSYSTYLPIHGMDVVIQTAHKLVGDNSISFNLIGNGQEFTKIKKYAETHSLKNVNFYPPVHVNDLPNFIENSQVVLGGHFGSSEKAQRVIPGKIYQALAMGKALIATDTPANRGLLTNEVNALLTSPNNPDLLADAIVRLKKDKILAQKISINGRLLFEERCSIQANRNLMQKILQDIWEEE